MSSLAIYLSLLIGGNLFLVRGFYVTRPTRRSDVAPYGLRNRSLQIILHPENYVTKDRLTEIRIFNTTGMLLLCTAPSIAVHDAYRAIAGY